MSDLISRSALLKYLRDYKWEFALGSDFSKAIEMVDVQPTAYDVDKVVEELEDYQMWKGFMIYDLTHREREIIRKAIEIVKGGGMMVKLQLIKEATFVCCPMCDEKKCVGRYNCNEIRNYIQKIKKRKNGVITE